MDPPPKKKKCPVQHPHPPGGVRVLCRVRLLPRGGGEGHVGAGGDEALHVGAVLKVRVQLLQPGGRLDVAEVRHGGVGGGDGVGRPVRDAGGREKQCDQIFGPRKARIFVKKREKMRQPKMSNFLLHFCTFQGGFSFKIFCFNYFSKNNFNFTT